MSFKESVKENKGTAWVYFILRFLVIVVMILQILHRNYHNVFVCVLTLIMFLIPVFVDRRLNIKLPNLLEIVILLFIFAAEILGEINSFYTRIPHWDTMLHTVNGFLMGAIGFAMIDILNQSPKIHISMSPAFVAFVSFCFSMTVGVVWEFFEYSMDIFFLTDMQKDWIVKDISSVMLNPSGLNETVTINDITKTVISGVIDGNVSDYVVEGGYLDIGIIDTMKDLIVNCLGTVIFSLIGAVYLTERDKSKVAGKFIPMLKTSEEIEEERMQNTRKRSAKRKK